MCVDPRQIRPLASSSLSVIQQYHRFRCTHIKIVTFNKIPNNQEKEIIIKLQVMQN